MSVSAAALSLEADAVRRYLLLMHEVAIRIDLVARAYDGRLSLTPPYAREYCYLQFRRICELVALGCLQLHGDLAIAQTNGAQKEWNAERIMKLLQREHPHSFPQSLTRTQNGSEWHLEANSKPNALTLSEFNILYAKCGEVLHRGTIRTMEAQSKVDASQYDKVAHWSRKIVDLLNEHVVAGAEGARIYCVSLKTEKAGPACSVFSNFQAGGVQVATYDLDVCQEGYAA